MWVLLAIGGCKQATSVSERLEPGQVRAGIVAEDEALFGGIAAEGRIGDIKLYNSEVQFVIQGMRPGYYLSSFSGAIVDADVVRPVGEPGRDIVNEWAPMFGFARYLDAKTVEVIADGSEGEAIVRATGGEGPLEYMIGALGIPHNYLGLELTQDYILRPDTHLLEVRSTIRAGSETVSIEPGDALQGAREVADIWEPVVGREGPTQGSPRDWTGFVSRSNDVAVLILRGEEAISGPGAMGLLGRLMLLAGGFAPEVEIGAGNEITYTRYYGVGRDVATLTDELLVHRGEATQSVEGVVEAPDGPVAGARVHVLVDGDPWTMAVTDEQGKFAALVRAGAETQVRATARGTGWRVEGALGAASYAPYTTEAARNRTIEAIAANHTLSRPAEGRGVATESAPLRLLEPGEVVARVGDGRPFEIRLTREEPDESVDSRLVDPRPDTATVVGWSRDGEMTLAVEPGRYSVLFHRGIRYSTAETMVDVVAGQSVEVNAVLDLGTDHGGWLLGDPHIHASPSSDGLIPMEERLVNSAAVGLQLHFGTDHDHVANYGPLLQPLGLSSVLSTVVADEASPFTRGHVNLYPLVSRPEEPNGGAWIWWNDPMPDTETQMAQLRERHGEEYVLQINHPFVMGMFGAAGWDPGVIQYPDYFSDDFQAFEVMNAGSYSDYLPLYLDLLNRGMVVAPMGTSDAHGYEGSLGMSTTFFRFGDDDPGVYSPEGLTEVVRQRGVIVSRGPFLSMSVDPGTTLTDPTTLAVEARSPDWIQVDKLELMKDGVVIEEVAGANASFELGGDTDASFIVIASGTTPMAPVWPGVTPWAMSSPILYDAAADGWDPPLAPLTLKE